MKKLILALLAIFILGDAMAQDTTQPTKFEIATLAGGCFWCTEAPYDELAGVEAAVSGYTNGAAADATYEKVSSGSTAHFEAVQVTFDPAVSDYNKILDVFWQHIDPFDAGGQFYDRGSQYYTAIFYHTDEQRKLAEASKAKIEAEKGKKVATQILAFKNFFAAEDYHQNYYKTNSEHYNAYKKGSGREEKLQKIWGSE